VREVLLLPFAAVAAAVQLLDALAEVGAEVLIAGKAGFNFWELLLDFCDRVRQVRVLVEP